MQFLYVVHVSGTPGCSQSSLHCISCVVHARGAHFRCLQGHAVWLAYKTEQGVQQQDAACKCHCLMAALETQDLSCTYLAHREKAIIIAAQCLYKRYYDYCFDLFIASWP